MDESLEDYVMLVDAAEAEGFSPIPKDEDLFEPALMSSIGWCNRVFRIPVHRPGESSAHERAFHAAGARAAADVLRHRVTVPHRVDEPPLDANIYEASSFFVARFFIERSPPDPEAYLARLALITFNLGAAGTSASSARKPSFATVSQAPDRTVFSTAPDVQVGLESSWDQRIDVVVTPGQVNFIVLKVTLDDMMTLTSDPEDWFQKLERASGR